ncbi:hypothetical protein JW756_02685 [Candidatus Woesearchaeota archaeon]|nr:hypothetical protein [Candidatus Woesearchaeota archaeon]
MTYAVDFVIDAMTKLSDSKPVMFQRDGSLFIASKQGFAQVTYGLHVMPQKRHELDSEVPEILESKNAILQRVKDTRGESKIVFRKTEKKCIQSIIFGTDDNTFTLEDIIKSASALQELPDDKKIRMVSHDSGYHSHKYGYAADGIDVWVAAARVMDRERYLELVRKNEDDMLESMARIKDIKHISTQPTDELYRNLKFPNCLILTPNLLASFPRKGSLRNAMHDEKDWNNSTRLENNWNGTNNGSILRYSELRHDMESPFSFYIDLNSSRFKAKTAEELANKGGKLINQMEKELEALRLAAEKGQSFIERLNAVHNEVCTIAIETLKKNYPNAYKRYQVEA